MQGTLGRGLALPHRQNSHFPCVKHETATKRVFLFLYVMLVTTIVSVLTAIPLRLSYATDPIIPSNELLLFRSEACTVKKSNDGCRRSKLPHQLKWSYLLW